MAESKGHVAEEAISEKAKAGIEKIRNGDKEAGLWNKEFNDIDAIAIAEAVRSSSSLHSLQLWENKIGDAGAAALGQALIENKTLLELNLSGNQIGDTGLIALGETLRTNTTLKALHIYDNPFTDAGIVLFAINLMGNTGLRVLRVFGDSQTISDGVAAALKELVLSSNINSFDNKGWTVGSSSPAIQKELFSALAIPIDGRAALRKMGHVSQVSADSKSDFSWLTDDSALISMTHEQVATWFKQVHIASSIQEKLHSEETTGKTLAGFYIFLKSAAPSISQLKIEFGAKNTIEVMDFILNLEKLAKSPKQ